MPAGLSDPDRIDILKLTWGTKVSAVRLIARTMRVGLLSRLLGVGVLASVLPMLLLTPLQAEVILLHSDCDGGTHVHGLDAADLDDWQAQHARENPCCEPGEIEGAGDTVGIPGADCDHNAPPIIIAKGPFLATRAGSAPSAHVAKALHVAVPAVVTCDPLVVHGTHIPHSDATGPAQAPGDGTATSLSRNHALLL
jgi:hypothetical protein